MGLTSRYVIQRGNTVPYPPLFDGIRRNHGFVDLRGRQDRVDAIPEAACSPALRALLMAAADPASPVATLGCDLGVQRRKGERLGRRALAGGYVQVALLPLGPPDLPGLRALASSIENRLANDVGEDLWVVEFGHCATHLTFAGLIETATLRIWFDAAASGPEKALRSRERLLASLAAGLSHGGLGPTLDGVGMSGTGNASPSPTR